ncbi:2-amino-4-hydroxy-6-hydroxymethyldihydropteridine diphosphokinase [Mangrovibacillus cuniculi]|uniref:2-amino-4-hydroxy-6-hydroxymethyldihydropteridine diphosphokinase n=1 Tax=Mangrovibacillus cuniculi TaxID=2593652 RepID=A0A7S8CDI4_9BACI|nr:2-amino-4-hydroxy-6-hydroxymethyldihydropteridine diphosphokinase [Mangrovibacillus cuniculi]QPC48002.1 2-amino-4-hydroxy-6-hydroxymethyldihydropteridine diphosphokinase [Mangrovibacillus cuniculi]
MNSAFISLGTNLGDRQKFLTLAIDELSAQCVYPEKISSIYETEPVGFTDQPNFLNMVVKVATNHSSSKLLEICLKTEKKLGRIRDLRWGPRTIDLDILLFNQENMVSEELTIPHPRMQERAFVLVPLLEIEPNIELPGEEIPLNSVLNEIPDKEGVRLWKQINGEGAFVHSGN